MTHEQIQALFTQEDEAVNSYTKDSPDELKPKKKKKKKRLHSFSCWE